MSEHCSLVPVPEADTNNSPECLTIAASVFRIGKGMPPDKLKERQSILELFDKISSA